MMIVGTATMMMAVVMSANRVDLGSFSSRCGMFRRTRTSADPLRVLCTRLAVTLTLLSLPSRLAPSARLTVGVPSRAVWLACVFLRRKTRCAGVVEPDDIIDWVLIGEGGGMTTPLLQYVARFDGGARLLGLEGEFTRRFSHGAPCLSSSRIYLKKTLNVSRPSEHPPVRGENVKTFRWGHRLQIIQDIFMAFKRVPRWQ